MAKPADIGLADAEIVTNGGPFCTACGMIRKVGDAFAFGGAAGIAHIVISGTSARAGVGTGDINGADIEEFVEIIAGFVVVRFILELEILLLTLFISTNSLLSGRLRLRFVWPPPSVAVEPVVGIFKIPLTDMAMAGTVPVPVAAMMEGSACSKSHLMVSPSDLCPSSRVSWKTLAAHVGGIRILRPRPSTLV